MFVVGVCFTDTPLFFDRCSPIPCLFNATLCVFRLHCPCLVECLSSVAWLRSRSCVFKCLGGKSAGESQTRPGQASEKGLASLWLHLWELPYRLIWMRDKLCAVSVSGWPQPSNSRRQKAGGSRSLVVVAAAAAHWLIHSAIHPVLALGSLGLCSLAIAQASTAMLLSWP